MRRRLTVLAVGAVVGAVMMAWAGASLAQTSADSSSSASAGRYIVVFKETVVSDPDKTANEMAKNYDLRSSTSTGTLSRASRRACQAVG